MIKYIELSEINYFKALDLGLKPMDWILRQATPNSDLLNKNTRFITYDGIILDFIKESNLPKDSLKVNSVEDFLANN